MYDELIAQLKEYAERESDKYKKQDFQDAAAALEASCRVDLRDTYDAIMKMQQDLQYEIQSYTLLSEADYRKIKALAATYELQEYLANRIAQAVNDGELEPDLEDACADRGYLEKRLEKFYGKPIEEIDRIETPEYDWGKEK